ncbi:MAG: serine/threonine protein kinase [Proteobacteria bacterium]|nr:serine/threonine protein kinase [Pseudomonadota bacterium]MBU1736664.1 serine/threonine protein kinase [Pseudomonadota bacterium]
MKETQTKIFSNLNPDTILDLAEESLGVKCSGICRPLNSYINRVYELETRDRKGLIIKFYRPDRWSEQALLDEHEFMRELIDHDIPVIPPLVLRHGNTLGSFSGVNFSIFERKGGRLVDEYNEEQWLELGRLMARTHLVGEIHASRERITLHPESSTRAHLTFLTKGNFIPAESLALFTDTANELIREIAPLFKHVKSIRIHGDCHSANIIQRPGESFFLIDFDDMALGPTVQDLWMLLPDHPNHCLYEIDLFLEGYETFRPFDRRELQLIEPLRAMRYIHFIAWCAHQAEDGAGPPTHDWGTQSYWKKEIRDLQDQLKLIREGPDHQYSDQE